MFSVLSEKTRAIWDMFCTLEVLRLSWMHIDDITDSDSSDTCTDAHNMHSRVIQSRRTMQAIHEGSAEVNFGRVDAAAV